MSTVCAIFTKLAWLGWWREYSFKFLNLGNESNIRSQIYCSNILRVHHLSVIKLYIRICKIMIYFICKRFVHKKNLIDKCIIFQPNLLLFMPLIAAIICTRPSIGRRRCSNKNVSEKTKTSTVLPV